MPYVRLRCHTGDCVPGPVIFKTQCVSSSLLSKPSDVPSSTSCFFFVFIVFLITVLKKIGSSLCRGDLLVEEIPRGTVLFRPEAKMLL